MYEILHDFAGPVATIMAAIAALVVTSRFSSRQADIAEQQAATARQQADIASMRLQYDLFDRRFRVYNEAKSLLAYCSISNVRTSSPCHLSVYQDTPEWREGEA